MPPSPHSKAAPPRPLFSAGIFEDQVAIVTGGGTGIGFGVARELVGLGAKVAICGRRPEPLAEAAKALGEEHVLHDSCDIRDADAVAAYVEKVKDRFGRIDILVNNAGGQFPSPAQHISPRGFEAVVRNNLLGTWTFTHAVANRAFIPQKRGRIVNIIAQVARGFPGMAHTGAARAGVANLTKTLAVEWAQFGVRVNAIAPGVIRTTGLDQYPPELLENAVRAAPVRRLGATEEVSHLVVYLASTYADFVTGQVWYIDGGASLWGDQWPIPDDIPQFPPYPE
ncbi:MAG TPA: SDR family oxidoreductase [Polyangiaceae bacterium]|nr:SDR family oxidoreductase [Polyangiaceae bacterium]